MVTGDNIAIAREIADQLGLGRNILPATSALPEARQTGNVCLRHYADYQQERLLHMRSMRISLTLSTFGKREAKTGEPRVDTQEHSRFSILAKP